MEKSELEEKVEEMIKKYYLLEEINRAWNKKRVIFCANKEIFSEQCLADAYDKNGVEFDNEDYCIENVSYSSAREDFLADCEINFVEKLKIDKESEPYKAFKDGFDGRADIKNYECFNEKLTQEKFGVFLNEWKKLNEKFQTAEIFTCHDSSTDISIIINNEHYLEEYNTHKHLDDDEAKKMFTMYLQIEDESWDDGVGQKEAKVVDENGIFIFKEYWCAGKFPLFTITHAD